MNLSRVKNLPLGWIMFFGFYLIVAVIYATNVSSYSGSGSVVHLRFWNGFTGRDGDQMTRMVRKFNEENPDIHITVQRIAWTTYYNKLFVAGQAAREPEIFISHTKLLPRFEQAGFFTPVDDLMNGPNGIDPNDIDKAIWEAVKINGKHVGVPLDIHPLGLYYNRDMFREAGIVDENGEPKPPDDRESFIDALRKLKKLDDKGNVERWGLQLGAQPGNVLTSWMHSYGDGLFYENDFTKANFMTEANIDGLQFAVDLAFKEKLIPIPRPQDTAGWDNFKQGKVGMYFGGIFMLNDLKTVDDYSEENRFEYAAAPFPPVDKYEGVWADSHVMCLSSNMDERELQAGWRFLKHLSDNSVEWSRGGQVPVRKSLRNSEEFQADDLEIQRIFAEQLDRVVYPPKITFSLEHQREFRETVGSVMLGEVTVEEGFQRMQNNIEKVMARELAAKQSN